MNPILYADGSPVLEGDSVTVTRRWFLFRAVATEGTVKYVCDVRKPLNREENDYGVDIAIHGGRQSLWFGGSPLPDSIMKKS